MQYKHESMDFHLSLVSLNSVQNKKNLVKFQTWKWAKKGTLKIQKSQIASQAKLLNRHTDRKRTVSLPHLKCLQLLNSSTCTTTKTKLIPKSKPIGFYLLIKNINSFQFITMVKSTEVFIFTTLDCTKIIWKMKSRYIVQSLTKAIIFELFYYINGYFRV